MCFSPAKAASSSRSREVKQETGSIGGKKSAEYRATGTHSTRQKGKTTDPENRRKKQEAARAK
jgi:hypothetical protein